MIIAVDFDGTCVTHEFPRWDIIRYYLHAKGIL